MKKILIGISAGVLLLAGIGVFAYYHYRNTPTYSLQAAVTALKGNNKEQIEKYIDFESILDSAFEDALNSKYPEAKDDPFTRGFTSLIKPSVVAIMKDFILKSLDEASTQAKEQDNMAWDGALQLKSFKTLQKKKYSAKLEVVLLSTENNQEIPLVLGMEKINDHWQIKTVKNFDQLADSLHMDVPGLDEEEADPA